ncbi:MAG: transglutaminase-like cysteine peptidase [Desulfuromonadales bacterium]|nr:transglutaminase-like cysteine peptidase [Desulfuromonadales bacterium]
MMVKARRAILLLGFGLLIGVGGFGASAAAAEVSTSLIPPGTGLFGSNEFKSSLKALPQWTRVLASASAQVEALSQCNPARDNCSAAALSWQKIIHEAQGQASFEKLKTVNAFFNRWPYRLDIDNYGMSEYWATPHEFLRLSGDCEDYSITKYYALKQLGVPVEKMRIVMLMDTIRGIAHAVLAVKQGDEYYVLDNLSDMVLSHLKYDHYKPQYSVNEHFRWAHVSPGLMR